MINSEDLILEHFFVGPSLSRWAVAGSYTGANLIILWVWRWHWLSEVTWQLRANPDLSREKILGLRLLTKVGFVGLSGVEVIIDVRCWCGVGCWGWLLMYSLRVSCWFLIDCMNKRTITNSSSDSLLDGNGEYSKVHITEIQLWFEMNWHPIRDHPQIIAHYFHITGEDESFIVHVNMANVFRSVRVKRVPTTDSVSIDEVEEENSVVIHDVGGQVSI